MIPMGKHRNSQALVKVRLVQEGTPLQALVDEPVAFPVEVRVWKICFRLYSAVRLLEDEAERLVEETTSKRRYRFRLWKEPKERQRILTLCP